MAKKPTKAKKVTRKDLVELKDKLWILEDYYNDYDSFIGAYGGAYGQMKTKPTRLEVYMFDYDEDEYAAVVITPKRNKDGKLIGGVSLKGVDLSTGKTVARGSLKDLSGMAVEKIWKMFFKIDAAHDMWDSYRR